MSKKAEVIELKNQGISNRQTAKLTGLHRETVSKYWKEYKQNLDELSEEGVDIKEIQDKLITPPVYKQRDKTAGRRRKYTDEIEERLIEILRSEKHKDVVLGAGHKQHMTNKQIHRQLQTEGYDIGAAIINKALARLRARPKNVYIRQEYDFGDRIEYDFGEVRLVIDGKTETCHMAVIASTAGKFRWMKLYKNQRKDVFLDSHVKFFEWIHGMYREVVYDNMKNVVKKFVGINEKELNPDLVKMSMYYGYKINVTNCFSGNEKGTVEKAVDVLRTELFTTNYTFSSLDAAQEYADSQIQKLNEKSLLEEERKSLLAYRPPLELAEIKKAKVDKTSLISVDNVKYSVPEELVGKIVIVKKYHDEIRVFDDNNEVCRHRREYTNGAIKIEIMHYLKTFERKPGALNNSIALKSIPQLKAIFDTHYKQKPREFIEFLNDNNGLDIEQIIIMLKEKTANKAEFKAISIVKPVSQVDIDARSSLSNYKIFVQGGDGA